MTSAIFRQTGVDAPQKLMRKPNLGVYLNRRPLDIDPRAMQDCLNVRVRDGRVRNEGMGWENFPQFVANADRINLDNQQVLLIDEYVSRAGSSTMILANQNDVFRFNASAGPPATITYMTPRYSTGTATNVGEPNNMSIKGTSTAWNTDIVTSPVTSGYGKNAKPGYEISFGSATEVALSATWYAIDTVPDDTHVTLLLDPGVIADGPYTIRQMMQGDNLDIWQSAIFQDAQPSNDDTYFLTNGVEMMSWDGLATQFSWFYPGFTGKGILAYKQTLVLWNLVDAGVKKPGSVAYSELNFPNNFTTNGAGRIQPADGVLDLLRIIPMGDQIVCYFEGDIVIMQYVGAPLYFIARVAVPGIGLVAQRAMMDFGDFHEFLSTRSSYRFDGVTIIETMNQVFREVLRKIAPNRIKQAYAHMDEENGEVIWSVPLASDGQSVDQAPTTAYTGHYLEDVGPNRPTPMSIREFPFTAIGQYIATSSLKFEDFPKTAEGKFDRSALQWDDRTLQQAFPFQLVGDANGDIYILNTSNARNGVAFKSFARFPRVALGDGDRKGLVQRIEPHTTRREGASNYSLKIILRIFDFADGDSIATHQENFDLSHQSKRYTPFRRSGRYGDVEFQTDGTGGSIAPQPWDVAGYSIKASALGDR